MRLFPFIILFILSILLGCNVTKDTEELEEVNRLVAPAPDPATQRLSYDQIKDLPTEEQWKHLSPKRRNYLRQHPDLYPKFKSLIAANPTMEEVSNPPSLPNNINQSSTRNADPSYVPPEQRTPAQWWATFSEKRKAYMREHADEYPDFKEFLKEE